MTAQSTQYLKQMGIEVWVLRERGFGIRAGRAKEAQAPVPPHAAETQAERSPSTRAVPTPIPRFHLCFLTGRHISLVFSIPAEVDAVPPAVRRLSADIMLAVEGEAEAATSTVRWPMVQSTHIDQSLDAARVVLRQRLGHCAPYLVVFGEEPANWIGDLSSRHGTVLEEIGTYLEAPLNKRQLWQSLQRARAEAMS